MTDGPKLGPPAPWTKPAPARRAPKAWSHMLYRIFGAADGTGQTMAGQLARAQRARHAMMRPRKARRRV